MTAAMHLVLVVEDDADIRAVLRTVLEAERYRVVEAENAARGEAEARNHKPDLVVMDLGLPDKDGVDLIRSVRRFSPVPIVVLSARTLEAQKIEALDAGADDFVVKPFSAAELLARARAALRRNARTPEQAGSIRLGDVELDLVRREARGPRGEIHLTPLEYRVLECLARQSGLVVKQAQLLREVWGPGREDDTRGLRVAIMNLRSKLERDPGRPRHIVTEAGIGYRLRS